MPKPAESKKPSIAELKKFVLLQDLAEDQIEVFIKDCDQAEYDPIRAKILAEGEAGAGLGLIIRGKVRVHKSDGKGGDHLLTVLKQGDFFGEMSLLDGQARSASVTALEPTVILWLRAEAFRDLVEKQNPVISKILARIVMELSNRLRLLSDRYVFFRGAYTGSWHGQKMG